MGAVKNALIAEADRNAVDNHMAAALAPDLYDLDCLVDAARAARDVLRDMLFIASTVTRKTATCAFDKLRNALEAFPEDPRPLSPVSTDPEFLYDPFAPPPGGGLWASEREYTEFLTNESDVI